MQLLLVMRILELALAQFTYTLLAALAESPTLLTVPNSARVSTVYEATQLE